MQDVYIAGVGMTSFGRMLDQSIKDLTAIAVGEALADAGCMPGQVEAAFFGNAVQGFMGGQVYIRGEIALIPLGFGGIPIQNVENACATASSAFHLAVNNVLAGQSDIALAVGAEKMVSTDREKMFSAFDSGWDIDTVDENARRMIALGEGVAVPEGSVSDKPYSLFMDVYAGLGRQIMRRHGITQRQIAAVASKNHNHSVHNEKSQYRKPMTVDEVLAAPPITYPFTAPMCSPISDGAAAVIVCNADGLKKLGVQKGRAVRVLASVMKSATPRGAEELDRHVTRLAALKAYEKAGVGPEGIDVAEVHDATAVGELIQMENLGLCEPGESGVASERGETSLGGRIPINPSGGLESRGHPVGATGAAQIYELVRQLRGECGERQVEGARIALQENGGGLWGYEEAAAHIGIFERTQT